MAEERGNVYVPSVSNGGSEKTVLGIFNKEEDAWDVMRGFLAKAAPTDAITGAITVWELDFVGEDASVDLVTFDRNACPICKEVTFWIEGDKEKARCYNARCGAWIEENAYEVGRWDCGWPAAQWDKRADNYEQARRRLVEMRGKSAVAGHNLEMPTREDWMAGREAERRQIRTKNVEGLLDEMME
jgi:hypothetical protein